MQDIFKEHMKLQELVQRSVFHCQSLFSEKYSEMDRLKFLILLIVFNFILIFPGY